MFVSNVLILILVYTLATVDLFCQCRSFRPSCSFTDEEEVDYLKTITREQVCQFFNEYIAGNGAQRRKLAVHVVPTEKPAASGGENPVTSSADGNDVTTCEKTDSVNATDSVDTTDANDTVEETDGGMKVRSS